MSVFELVRLHRADVDYTLVEQDKAKVLEIYKNKKYACLVRAGDTELAILEGKKFRRSKGKINLSRPFVSALAYSLEYADLVGLPNDYIHSEHIYNWDKQIIEACSKLSYKVQETRVSAVIFYLIPELLGILAENKNVIFINFNAHKFKTLTQNPSWCNFYNFNNFKQIHTIDIPDGKGGRIFKQIAMEQVVAEVKKKLNKIDFDIIFIGAGAMANIIAIYVKEKLQRSAIDCGAILSAMRGQRNRGCFRVGGKNTHLVWSE